MTKHVAATELPIEIGIETKDRKAVTVTLGVHGPQHLHVWVL